VLVVGDAAGDVYGFEGKSGAALWARRGSHEGGVLAMAIRPDGAAFATAGQDGRVLIWNAAEGQVSEVVELGNGWVENVAWSSDGQWLAASISRCVHVYDAGGKEAWRSDEHLSTISAIAWSSAQELATACYGRVTFFDAPTGKLRQKLEWKASFVSMVLSPVGNIVACGSQDNLVHFWRRSTEEVSMMAGYSSKPSTLAFDDTGTLLATGGGEAVTVWSFQGSGPEGTEPSVLEIHIQPITTLAFAHHGMLLASGARDCGVVVWALQSDGGGDPVGIALVADAVAELYWRPDSRALAALDAQGGVTVWQIGSGHDRL
jgi:WD40 repeat protein